MLIQGPNNQQENADKAYHEMMDFLKEKYQIQKIEAIPRWQNERDLNNKDLLCAIRQLFKYDSWENW